MGYMGVFPKDIGVLGWSMGVFLEYVLDFFLPDDGCTRAAP